MPAVAPSYVKPWLVANHDPVHPGGIRPFVKAMARLPIRVYGLKFDESAAGQLRTQRHWRRPDRVHHSEQPLDQRSMTSVSAPRLFAGEDINRAQRYLSHVRRRG